MSMTPRRVFERLQKMSELSAKETSPMPRGVDMSPRAVAARLQEMAALDELCRTLETGRVANADATNGDAGGHRS